MFDDQQTPAGSAPANLPTEPVDMFAGVDEKAPVAPPKLPDALSSGMLKRKSVETLKAPTAAVASASAPLPSADETETTVSATTVSSTSQPIVGKILAVILILAAVFGIGWGAWWFYANYIRKTPAPVAPVAAPAVPTAAPTTPPPAETPPSTAPAPTANQPAAVSTSTINTNIQNDSILFGQPIDTDKDGLPDVREKELGTDPNNPDTDGDGLTDGQEVLVYHTNPLKSDTDGDGLSDGDEVLVWKTDPLNPDTDGDGYPDGEEVQSGYNPLGRGKLLNTSTSSTTPVTTTTKPL